VLIAIDGTGCADQEEYDKEMKNSFVHQLIRNYMGGEKYYLRGPTMAGLECKNIRDYSLGWAAKAVTHEDSLDLAGYSRGGAIAIAIAQEVAHKFPNAKIRVMALFDAVDREMWFGDLSTIPANVGYAFHALRDPIVQSRMYFENCGLKADPPCTLKTLTFVTTHAGMGGVPLGKIPLLPPLELVPEKLLMNKYVGPDTERLQSRLVHQWMWANLRKIGVVH